MTGNEEDLLAIVDEFDPFREIMRGIVAMFTADGFTDEQARDIAVALLVKNLRDAGRSA